MSRWLSLSELGGSILMSAKGCLRVSAGNRSAQNYAKRTEQGREVCFHEIEQCIFGGLISRAIHLS